VAKGRFDRGAFLIDQVGSELGEREIALALRLVTRVLMASERKPQVKNSGYSNGD
jgi:hypothetical protein